MKDWFFTGIRIDNGKKNRIIDNVTGGNGVLRGLGYMYVDNGMMMIKFIFKLG